MVEVLIAGEHDINAAFGVEFEPPAPNGMHVAYSGSEIPEGHLRDTAIDAFTPSIVAASKTDGSTAETAYDPMWGIEVKPAKQITEPYTLWGREVVPSGKEVGPTSITSNARNSANVHARRMTPGKLVGSVIEDPREAGIWTAVGIGYGVAQLAGTVAMPFIWTADKVRERRAAR